MTETAPTQNWIVRKPPVAREGRRRRRRRAASRRRSARASWRRAATRSTPRSRPASRSRRSSRGTAGSAASASCWSGWRARAGARRRFRADLPAPPRSRRLSADRRATDGDLFSWPRVKDDRNVMGPLSIAVPGHVDGLGLALETFGTAAVARRPGARDRAGRARPAGRLVHDPAASRLTARELARYPDDSAGLAAGRLPAGDIARRCRSRGSRIPRLADTLRRLSETPGAATSTRATSPARSSRTSRSVGGALRADDLAATRRASSIPLCLAYRGTHRPDRRRPHRRPDHARAGWRCSSGSRSERHPRPTPTSPTPTRCARPTRNGSARWATDGCRGAGVHDASQRRRRRRQHGRADADPAVGVRQQGACCRRPAS